MYGAGKEGWNTGRYVKNWASAVHHPCVGHASSVRRPCVVLASAMRRVCVGHASSVRRPSWSNATSLILHGGKKCRAAAGRESGWPEDWSSVVDSVRNMATLACPQSPSPFSRLTPERAQKLAPAPRARLLRRNELRSPCPLPFCLTCGQTLKPAKRESRRPGVVFLSCKFCKLPCQKVVFLHVTHVTQSFPTIPIVTLSLIKRMRNSTQGKLPSYNFSRFGGQFRKGVWVRYVWHWSLLPCLLLYSS